VLSLPEWRDILEVEGENIRIVNVHLANGE
jgi:hypothetical protein